jgi:3-deoxy-D-manno-octulosonic-acid transferase
MRRREAMFMILYSLLLATGLVVSAPWWLWRMATSGRYREGLGERLGFVPADLRAAVAGKKTVWVHAVSVGEVLAAERLIAELKTALGDGWVVAVSTTTATGQKIARERLAHPGKSSPVFFYPLDFAFAVRRWLRVLRPSLLVLVESEFWPRMLVECERVGVPVAVVNARVSDRSFPRYMRLRRLWKPLLEKVSLFLAQGEESAERLREIGAPAEQVKVSGNLKYDMQPNENTAMVNVLRFLLRRRKLVVAGSLLEGEEALLLDCWWEIRSKVPEAVLLLAPRHKERFERVAAMSRAGFQFYRATELIAQAHGSNPLRRLKQLSVIFLDTIGDLAAVYSLADAAFVGGSLVPKGGHNPLEAARFGVPVLMGPSYENFREIVDGMRAADAIKIGDQNALKSSLTELLLDDNGMGERAKRYFEAQPGATRRSIQALVRLIGREV